MTKAFEEACEYDDGNCTAGGVKPTADLLNSKFIQFNNYPHDDLSVHILRLIAIHLPTMNDSDKYKLIKTFNEILDIQPLKKGTF